MRIIFRVITALAKLLMKLVLLPVVIALSLVEGICIVATSILHGFFSLAGFIIILTGILSFYFELDPVPEVKRTIAIGIGFYILPMIAESLTTLIGWMNLHMHRWLIT